MKNIFFVIQCILGRKDGLKSMKKLTGFITNLTNKIYKTFPKRLKAREWTSYSDKYDSYLEKNQNTIKSILLRLTQSYSAPPTPSGFL